MSAPPVPLVWAKLQPPMPPIHAVHRSALLDELEAVDAPVLTAIVAPAGYGKTTLAAQLVERSGRSVPWVALEPADSDPARFWTYVTAAFGKAGVERLDDVYQRLGEGPASIDDAVALLRAGIEQATEPFALVLDDFQTIENETVHAQLSELLHHPPTNLTVICLSRSDLPLPVGRLRSQGQLAEARVDRLAFTADEVVAVLDGTFGLAPLSEPNVAALVARTEGWPVGVYLAGLGLKNESEVDAFVARFSGDSRHLSEYLSAEAIDDLDPELRAFLLTTSVASILVPDLCDMLTGQPGSLGTLRSLVKDNVFTVALNHQATLFRYHPLFQEHLQSLLAAEFPDDVAELHDRASRWHEGNDDVDQAITHAALGGQAKRASRLIAESWALFARAGQLGRLEQWITLLGDAATADTEVCLMMNWVLLNSGRIDEMERWAQAARRVATTDMERALCALEIPTLHSHRQRRRGDIGAALTSAHEALAAIDFDVVPNESDSVPRLAALPATALAAAGVAHYWAGELDEARRLLTESVTHARSSGELSSVIQGYCYLAAVEADSGREELALAHADQVLELVDEANEGFHLPAMAHVARAMALLALGRPADAEAAIEEGIRLARSLDDLTLAAAWLQRARIRHGVGDRDGARGAVREANSIVANLPDARFEDRIRRVENEIRFAAKPEVDFGFGPVELTDREQSVLALLPHELSRAELAAQLHVSENTVKTHLTSIRRKLGLRGREPIVERARELGLLS